MTDNLSFITDIETECRKFLSDCKKKYSKIKESIDSSLKVIEKLKTILPNSEEDFKKELNTSINLLLKPIYLVSEGKQAKLFLSSLNLLKKYVIYNFINDIEYNNLINLLKEMFHNSSSQEEIQFKILEILQYLINSNITQLTDDNINNIMILSCEMFHMKNFSIKNTLKLVLGLLIKKIFDLANDNSVLILLKNLTNLIEGTQKEWINQSNLFSKCLGLELISIIIETYYEKFNNNSNDGNELRKFVEDGLKNVILKIFANNNIEQIIGIKNCRLTMIIITKLNLSLNKNLYSLIEEGILKYLEKNNNIFWQRVIGLECLSELFKKSEIIYDIFVNQKQTYQKIIETFTNITYQNVIIKSKNIYNTKNEPNDKISTSSSKKQNDHNQINQKPPSKKYIFNNNILLTENDYLLVPSKPNSGYSNYIFLLLKECFVNVKNSFVDLMEKNGIKLNEIDKNKNKTKNNENNDNNENKLNEKQNIIKEMINYDFVNFKGGLIGMLINMNEVSSVQSFISILQNFIYIYTAFDLPSSRDELLNDLCKLSIPNNLENILEIKEKNILIIRTIFNLSHCTNLLESSSWLIFIQTVQNLYFTLIKSGYYLYTNKQQFNIDIIMKNIESNIKKYSYESSIFEVQKVVQEDEASTNISNVTQINVGGKGGKEHKNKKKIGGHNSQLRVLSDEEKENIDILSNVVNNLFIDSNDFDDNTLIDILNALYENSEKIIINIYKEINQSNINNNNIDQNEKNYSNTQPKRKNSDSALDKKNKEQNANLNNFNDLAKKTERIDGGVYASVIGGGIGNNNMNINMNLNFMNDNTLTALSNLNFNLVKILGITIINVNRIDLFWDKLVKLVNLFLEQSVNNISINDFNNTIIKFTIEILSYIIITVLLQYKIKENKNENTDDNSLFSEKKIQQTLFSLLQKFTENNTNYSYLINPLKKILEKCGTKLNTYGWSLFIEIINEILTCGSINSKENENVYKIVEQVFNEYSNYLTIFNIETLLDILEKFSINKENINLCYSSISYFWQCADILENYQKKKTVLNGLELETFNEKYPEENDKNNFYENLWKNIFRRLIIINKDERFDVKKTGINVFSQFFLAKIKTINELNDINIDIINNTFFKVLNANVDNFLSIDSINEIKNNDNNEEKDDMKENENKDENNQNIINTNKNEEKKIDENNGFNEKEEIVIVSLQGLGKVIKILIEENKNNHNEEDKNIFKKIIDISIDLISKKNSNKLTICIIKNISDIETAHKEFFHDNRQISFSLIEVLIKFISNEELFINKYTKSIKGNKVLQSIIEILTNSFYSKEAINILNNKPEIDNNLNFLLNEAIPKILKGATFTDQTLFKMNPLSLINLEKELFNLLDNCVQTFSDPKNIEMLLNYLMNIIKIKIDDLHSIPVSSRSVQCIGGAFEKNKIFEVGGEKMKEMTEKLIKDLKEIIGLKKNDEILKEMVNHNVKKKETFGWEVVLKYLLNSILPGVIIECKDEKMWESIVDYLIGLYQEIKEENYKIINKKENDNDNEIKRGDLVEDKKEENVDNNDNKKEDNKDNNNEEKKDENKKKEEKDNSAEYNKQRDEQLLKSNKEIEKSIINFIVNSLLPNSGFISNNIQEKILTLLDINSINDNKEEKENENQEQQPEKLFSLKNMNLENLFNVCNFKGATETHKELLSQSVRPNDNNINADNQEEKINQYIDFKKKISKIFLPLLLSTCLDKIKKYINEKDKNENNDNNDNKNDELELINMLNNLNKLNSACEEIKDWKKIFGKDFNEEEIKNNDIMKVCLKNKKGHLFLLQGYFSKLIFSKNNGIQNSIQEIFNTITEEMSIPKY